MTQKIKPAKRRPSAKLVAGARDYVLSAYDTAAELLNAQSRRDLIDVLGEDLDLRKSEISHKRVARKIQLLRAIALRDEPPVHMNTSIAVPTELLVLSGRGIRIGALGHYGLFDETPTLNEAIDIARGKLAAGHARSFVAIRIEAAVIDGIGDGTDRELVRFEVYPDRVALVPVNQGGLSDEQAAKARALPKKGLL